jgi:hypothetical protein
MYPYQGTQGLTFADRDLAVNFKVDLSKGKACLGLCPSGTWRGDVGLWIAPKKVGIQNFESLLADEQPLRSWSLQLSPNDPFYETIVLSGRTGEEIGRLILGFGRPGEKGWRVLKPERTP